MFQTDLITANFMNCERIEKMEETARTADKRYSSRPRHNERSRKKFTRTDHQKQTVLRCVPQDPRCIMSVATGNQSMWAKRERRKNHSTLQTYFCNPHSPLRSSFATSCSAPSFFGNSRSPLRFAWPDFPLALLRAPLQQ